jgi:GAF domain-containing protein
MPPLVFLWLNDSEQFHAAALHNAPARYAKIAQVPCRPLPNNPLGRMLRGERVITSVDAAADEPYLMGDPVRRALVDLGGARSFIQVALAKEDDLLGSLTVYRQEVRPFSEKQISLLQNFAAQAVIAIENARLINETREALEQQTATTDVLRVINSSPGNVPPVFDAMLGKAVALCEATFGTLWTYDGKRMHAAAVLGAPPRYTDFLRAGPHPPSPVAHQPLLGGAQLVHIRDVAAHDGYRSGTALPTALVELGNVRTLLAIPLRKDTQLLGVFSIYRNEVRPFSDKQIGLLQNFAGQAVIAMENARLLTETREALEQQTATAEVLGVINTSPSDLAPVFEAMLDKAMRLCEAAFGALFLFDNDRFIPIALRGVPAKYRAFLTTNTMFPGPGTGPYRFLRGGERAVIEETDLAQSDAYRAGDPQRCALVNIGGAHSAIQVPLCKDDAVLGVMTLYRQEVRPFTEKQIGLLQNFAAQAVIAMENARLLGQLRERTEDLQESLDYQTATSDLLEVISRSASDIKPVFETMLASAARLCGVAKGDIVIREGDAFRYAASIGPSPEELTWLKTRTLVPGRTTTAGRALLERQVVQTLDQTDDSELIHPNAVKRARTVLAVPLLREGEPIGVITLLRDRVEAFSERQIALIRTFADQAVIAMENARLPTGRAARVA